MSTAGQTAGSLSKYIIPAVAVGVAAFVGYAIYFDSKRRSDPEYKQKVAEKRRQRKLADEARAKREAEEAEAQKAAQAAQGGPGGMQPPSNEEAERIQQFLMEGFKKGDELLAANKVEDAVTHYIDFIVEADEKALTSSTYLLLMLETRLIQNEMSSTFMLLMTKFEDHMQKLSKEQREVIELKQAGDKAVAAKDDDLAVKKYVDAVAKADTIARLTMIEMIQQKVSPETMDTFVSKLPKELSEFVNEKMKAEKILLELISKKDQTPTDPKDVERMIKHFANAIRVSDQQTQMVMLQSLQQLLDPSLLQLLVRELTEG
eukprot:Clim_evm38s232 gene=Clim_evmTU38s232